MSDFKFDFYRSQKGFFEIGIFHPKTQHNIGTLFRTAVSYGASGIFTIGRRYSRQSSDTCKSSSLVPLRHYESFDDFLARRPLGALLIGIELGGISLDKFSHPKNCIYLLGAEDHGLSKEVINKCNSIVTIDTLNLDSLNVSAAGAIVMNHRFMSFR